MARLFTDGFEIANDTAGHSWTNAGVSGAGRSTSNVRTGSGCGQVTGLVSATQAGWGVQFVSAVGNGPYYARVYLRVDAAPSADNCIIAFIAGANVTSVSTNDAQIRLSSTSTLKLFAANSQVGSASAALSAGYHLVELEIDNGPAAGSKIVRGYLDGTQFAGTTTSSDIGGTVSGIAVGGNLNAEAQTQGDWSVDDIAVNDNTGSFQTARPSSGKVIVLWPNAAGDSNQFNNTANGAGDSNNYTLVDEASPDDATTMVQSGTLNNLDLYNMQASGIGSADTVNVVHVHLRRRNNVADATTAVNAVVVKTSGGTQSNGTAVIPNSTTWRTGSTTSSTHIAPNHTLYQDPDGSAWTQSTLDTMQAGPKITAANVNRCQVSTVWATVDYTPSVAAENASATGTAETPSIAVAPTSEAATATGVAETPAASVKPSAESAATSAAAQDATTAVSPGSEHAAATGTAETPSVAVAVSAECATASATAHDATVTTETGGTSAPAECATATAQAEDATSSVAPSADPAAATGAAETPSVAVHTSADTAAATGAAHDASVSTSASTSAVAECATATGVAETPTPAVAPSADPATATGEAFDPADAVGPTAECAAASAVAEDPLAQSGVFTLAVAECASAVGEAFDPGGTIAFTAEPATASATAEAFASVGATATTAEATGAAWDLSAAVAVLAEAAAVIAAAYDAEPYLGPRPADSVSGVAAGRTSNTTVSAARTSTPAVEAEPAAAAVTAGRASTPAVSASRTSSSSVG